MRESSAGWTDQELIERMRRNETLAFHELFWRFQTLLVRYAKLFGVQPALREETVVETLNDAAVTLMKYSTRIPRSLVAYLVSSVRHRVGASARSARRVAEGEREFNDELDSADVLARSSSEASLRASRGPWGEASVLSPALERLASALDEGLTEEERMILDWVARWVPQRVIAEWVGMSHGALRIRVWRLRERLREAAVVYADHLSPAERLELKDFFRRTAMLRREDVADSTPAPRRHGPADRARIRDTRARFRWEEQ